MTSAMRLRETSALAEGGYEERCDWVELDALAATSAFYHRKTTEWRRDMDNSVRV